MCLTQCPQAIYTVIPHALRYSFLSLCRLTAAVFFKILMPAFVSGHELRDSRHSQIRMRRFFATDSDSHRNCRSGCSDASLVLCGFHFHTTQHIFQHFEKLCPRKHWLSAPVYGSRISLYMQVFDADGLVFTPSIVSCSAEIISLIRYFFFGNSIRCYRLWDPFSFGKSALFPYKFSSSVPDI